MPSESLGDSIALGPSPASPTVSTTVESAVADVVRDGIAEMVAAESRVAETPGGALSYGSDISCQADLDDAMREVDGVLVLAEALVRRLDCPRGRLPDDPDYGIDLRGFLNRPTTADELRGLAGQVRAELAKDDRVAAAVVTVTPSGVGQDLRVDLRVTPVAAALGPFGMILAVTSAAVLIEEVTP